MEDQYTDVFDDDWDYEIWIWVETDKSLAQFEECLTKLIAPVRLNNHEFSLGAIHCKVMPAEEQPPSFPGVAHAHYSFIIIVPIVLISFGGSLIDSSLFRSQMECEQNSIVGIW